MGRTSRKVGRTTTEQGNVSYVKWIVTDGKELGQHSESQARVPPNRRLAYLLPYCISNFECFKSEVSEYKGDSYYREDIRGPQRSLI